jgi:hypothetical protein
MLSLLDDDDDTEGEDSEQMYVVSCRLLIAEGGLISAIDCSHSVSDGDDVVV